MYYADNTLDQNYILLFFRDIKPSNILVKTYHKNPRWKSMPVHEMSFKLADYDFARHFNISEPGDTTSKSVVGSWRYMAPEIETAFSARNSSAPYTSSADIFSLGVVCYEIFKGGLLPEAGRF